MAKQFKKNAKISDRLLENCTTDELQADCDELFNVKKFRQIIALQKHLLKRSKLYDQILAAIKNHRDQRGDDRCFLDDLDLYRFLPDTPVRMAELMQLPPRNEFLKSCERFWNQRQPANLKVENCPKAMTIAQLQKTIEDLRDIISELVYGKNQLLNLKTSDEKRVQSFERCINKAREAAEKISGPIAVIGEKLG